MQFCNQCGGPIEGNPANCPSCGAVRAGTPVPAAVSEFEATAAFTPPAALTPEPSAAVDPARLAPDTRFNQPGPPPAASAGNGLPADPAARKPLRFDPNTGQPVYAEPANDSTNVIAAQPGPPPNANGGASGGGLFGFDPLANLDDTGAMAPPPPQPAYAPPPPPQPAYAPPPPPQPAYAPPPAPVAVSAPVGSDSDEFHAAPLDGQQDSRPEIREVITRVLGGRYIFEREIGAGGMSIVYEMKDTVLQTDVAVKVLYPELAINPEVANRFKNEAVITAKLTGNPYIIKVYDYGYKERVHYIITQFLSGKSLRDEMKERFLRNEKFDWREASEIMIKVGKALESVHAKQVVHRDIKPGNIIFENGSPILIDFGIAKIPQQEQGREWLVTTQAGMSLGTPHYISPEEAQGLGSNPKSDIYSLGVVFYEMVTGRVPFDGESAQAIMIDHVTKEPDDPTLYNSALPSHVAQVILKLLRKDPNQRLSASEMVQTLESILGINQRGSSAAAEAVAAGSMQAGGGGGGGGRQPGGGATIVTGAVPRGKRLPSAKGGSSQSSPVMLIVLGLIALGGIGYVAYPYVFPQKTEAKTSAPPPKELIDPKTQQMDALYDKAVAHVGEGKFKTAEEEFKQVYEWKTDWRQVSADYDAVKDFNEGKTAYLSGRSRNSFEKAIEFFDKCNQTWTTAMGKEFPHAKDYETASQHMSDAIGAEDHAQQSADSGDAIEYMKGLWDAQKSYQSVTETLQGEAGAYFARLDDLVKYYKKAQERGDSAGVSKAKAEIKGTIDEGLGGLENDKGNLLVLYRTWAIPLYENLFSDDATAKQMTADADRTEKDWIAAGKPGPDDEDTMGAEEASKQAAAAKASGGGSAGSGDSAGSTPASGGSTPPSGGTAPPAGDAPPAGGSTPPPGGPPGK